MRTCDLFNVDGVIILDKRQVDINATVAKTSAGAFNYVPVCRVNNLTNAIEYLKTRVLNLCNKFKHKSTKCK